MSTLKVNQTKTKLRQKFESNLDMSDIYKKDPESEPKILTRCLAAAAMKFATE
jgi:hypothetical protein